jgi:hypothetical protein
MKWFEKNWIWILLAIPAAFIGWEIVAFLYATASRQPASCWFNKLKFWNSGSGETTGPSQTGSNCGGRAEAASCVPASARTSTGGGA